MTSRPEGGGVHDDLTEVSIDFGCSRRIQEHVADMVHACPNRKVAVGVLEVIRHACFVRCFVSSCPSGRMSEGYWMKATAIPLAVRCVIQPW